MARRADLVVRYAIRSPVLGQVKLVEHPVAATPGRPTVLGCLAHLRRCALQEIRTLGLGWNAVEWSGFTLR